MSNECMYITFCTSKWILREALNQLREESTLSKHICNAVVAYCSITSEENESYFKFVLELQEHKISE